MELSKQDRWILSNQYIILEKIDPAKKHYYENCREVIESGFELNYDWILERILNPMPQALCSEVIDILDMYESLQYSYNSLSAVDKSSIDEQLTKFPGFDGNNETAQLSYARFLTEKEGKFSSLDRSSYGQDLNSHYPSLDKYRKMLEKFNKVDMSRRSQLTKTEITDIMNF